MPLFSLTTGGVQAAFADSRTTVLTTNVDHGPPLVHARFGSAQSEVFALDAGSPHLYVMEPFVARFAAEIARHWAPAGPPFFDHYLEGDGELQPFRVANFASRAAPRPNSSWAANSHAAFRGSRHLF